MVYATRAEGFRPGGANNVPGVGNEVPLTYAPDSLASYELGAKLGFWKGKVTVNSALYRIDWDSMQVSAASTNGAWRFVTNAGRARILGAEIEAIAVPAPGLWLMVNGAFNDARLMEDQRNAVGFGAGVAGDRVPFTPKWTGAVSVVRREPIGAYNTVARFDYTYTGVSASEFRPTAITYQKQPAYGLVDVQLSAERGGLEVSARLTNLFDVSAPLMVATNLSGVRDQTFGARPRALTLGLRKTF
jgi:outer membrane receptor protein involved in Fe transport